MKTSKILAVTVIAAGFMNIPAAAASAAAAQPAVAIAMTAEEMDPDAVQKATEEDLINKIGEFQVVVAADDLAVYKDSDLYAMAALPITLPEGTALPASPPFIYEDTGQPFSYAVKTDSGVIGWVDASLVVAIPGDVKFTRYIEVIDARGQSAPGLFSSDYGDEVFDYFETPNENGDVAGKATTGEVYRAGDVVLGSTAWTPIDVNGETRWINAVATKESDGTQTNTASTTEAREGDEEQSEEDSEVAPVQPSPESSATPTPSEIAAVPAAAEDNTDEAGGIDPLSAAVGGGIGFMAGAFLVSRLKRKDQPAEEEAAEESEPGINSEHQHNIPQLSLDEED